MKLKNVYVIYDLCFTVQISHNAAKITRMQLHVKYSNFNLILIKYNIFDKTF